MTLKTMDAEKILSDALALPVSERAALAAALLASLDETEGGRRSWVGCGDLASRC